MFSQVLLLTILLVSIPRFGAEAISYDFLDCTTFLEHSASINAAFGIKDPRRIAGFSRLPCENVFDAAKKAGLVDSVVNLATFLRENGVAALDDPHALVPDEAGYQRRQLGDTCDDDIVQGNPGSGSNAEAIPFCDALYIEDNSTNSTRPPCIPEYLKAPNASSTYANYQPSYPKGSNYDSFTSQIDSLYWDGCNRDRTSAGPIGSLLISIITNKALLLVADIACKIQPGGITIVIPIVSIPVTLPNPGKLVCITTEAVGKLVLLGLESAFKASTAQNNWANGAEIKAAYEQSRNLLQKQCAIFDQAVCRSADQLGVGSGCDGVDSNCNQEIDECDEDIVPPTIDTTEVYAGCTDVWFSNLAEAEACVAEAVRIADDCQTTNMTVVGTGDCTDATVAITSMDRCGNTATATVAVQIQGVPSISCAFPMDNYDPEGSGPYVDTDLVYVANDSCSGMPLDVTLVLFSNEMDARVPQLAYFDESTNLFVEQATCKGSDEDCLDDPSVDGRVYTIVARAVEPSGVAATGSCMVSIADNEGKTIDPNSATQRIRITSKTISTVAQP